MTVGLIVRQIVVFLQVYFVLIDDKASDVPVAHYLDTGLSDQRLNSDMRVE